MTDIVGYNLWMSKDRFIMQKKSAGISDNLIKETFRVVEVGIYRIEGSSFVSTDNSFK